MYAMVFGLHCFMLLSVVHVVWSIAASLCMYVLACKKHIKLLLLYLSKQYGDGFVLFLK